MPPSNRSIALLVFLSLCDYAHMLSIPYKGFQKVHKVDKAHSPLETVRVSRRDWLMGALATVFLAPHAAQAIEDLNQPNQTTMFKENLMKRGGQVGKVRPYTRGAFWKTPSREPMTGNTLGEVFLKGTDQEKKNVPILFSFVSPWPLQTGALSFDIGCRDPSTGDGVFVAVSPTGVSSNEELCDSTITKTLSGPSRIFSLLGPAQGVKILKSSSMNVDGNTYRVWDVEFYTLSQSRQTELPYRARVVATVPPGTNQAILLVGYSTSLRWRTIERTISRILRTFEVAPSDQVQVIDYES